MRVPHVHITVVYMFAGPIMFTVQVKIIHVRQSKLQNGQQWIICTSNSMCIYTRGVSNFSKINNLCISRSFD